MKATTGLALTYIEILNDVNLSQVFLWFQERELMSTKVLCYNPNPGLAFRASDMVRNLILSCYMS